MGKARQLRAMRVAVEQREQAGQAGEYATVASSTEVLANVPA